MKTKKLIKKLKKLCKKYPQLKTSKIFIYADHGQTEEEVYCMSVGYWSSYNQEFIQKENFEEYIEESGYEEGELVVNAICIN